MKTIEQSKNIIAEREKIMILSDTLLKEIYKLPEEEQNMIYHKEKRDKLTENFNKVFVFGFLSDFLVDAMQYLDEEQNNEKLKS